MDIVPNLPPEPSKRICIIGAGASGLAALKVVTDSAEYQRGAWSVIAYESRSNVGGIWFPAAPEENQAVSPLCDSLTTNLPHPIMAYTSYSFPPSTPLYPVASVVQRYLESYASHFNLLPLIQLNTEVAKARWKLGKWAVTTSTGDQDLFDHLVVANGHYTAPRIPQTPGLDHWLTSGRAMHSAFYRRPHGLGDKVVIVGAGPSGQDLVTDMRNAGKTVIHSIRGAETTEGEHFRRRGTVAEFKTDGSIIFEDGAVEKNVDRCLLATGYVVEFPFFGDSVLKPEIPPPCPPIPSELFNSTYSVFPLSRQLFPLQAQFPPSSLVFMCLLYKIAPLPVAEAQAMAMVRAFADPSSLEPTQEAVDIMTRYENFVSKGIETPAAIYKAWHRFGELEQFDYRDELYSFAAGGSEGRQKVSKWERELYPHKVTLREKWVALVKSGRGEEFVRGVGEGGTQEWVDAMWRLLRLPSEEKETSTTDCRL